MQIRGLIATLALCVLAVTGTARGALSDLTLDPNPAAFSNGLISGQITLIEVQQGLPGGANILEGFASYITDGKSLGDDGGTVNFMITPGSGLGSTFSISVPLIPGPAAPALLGVAALLTGRRRRRR